MAKEEEDNGEMDVTRFPQKGKVAVMLDGSV